MEHPQYVQGGKEQRRETYSDDREERIKYWNKKRVWKHSGWAHWKLKFAPTIRRLTYKFHMPLAQGLPAVLITEHF